LSFFACGLSFFVSLRNILSAQGLEKFLLFFPEDDKKRNFGFRFGNFFALFFSPRFGSLSTALESLAVKVDFDGARGFLLLASMEWRLIDLGPI
jgi:hypothetical protein